MRKILLLFLFLSTLLSAYSQRLIYSSDFPVEKIRIILEQLRGGTVSENLTDLEYIPLGGGKNDIIDYISNIIITPNNIGIISNSNQNLYIYDLKGNLIKRISEIEGFKPKNKVLFYNIQQEKGKIVAYGDKLKVVFNEKGEILEKNLDYKYMGTKTFVSLQDTKFYYGSPSTGKKDSLPEYGLKMNDSILVRYDPRDTIGFMFANGDEIIKTSEEIGFAVFPNTYRVAQLNPKGVSKIIQFVFPYKNTVDTSNYDIYKTVQSYFNFMENNRDKITSITDAKRYKQYLLFQVIGSTPTRIALNLSNNEIISLNKILPDKSNDYLEFLGYNLLTTDGEYIYTIIFPNDIARAKEKSKIEGHSMRKEYLQLEKSLNPILVRFKLK